LLLSPDPRSKTNKNSLSNTKWIIPEQSDRLEVKRRITSYYIEYVQLIFSNICRDMKTKERKTQWY